MTQDQRWIMMWQKYMDFLHNNKRRPSKYQPEERDLVNWAKHNRKLVNKGVLKADRKTRFDQLVAEAEKYQRVNQHQYVNGESTHEQASAHSSLTPSSLTPNPSPKERGVECSAGSLTSPSSVLHRCLEAYHAPLLWRGDRG